MSDILFIQEYYYYLIAFSCFIMFLSLRSYMGSNVVLWGNFFVASFAIYSVYYIGMRSVDIGVDTIRYEAAFQTYKYATQFAIRKDPLYDFLSFSFSKYFSFQVWLVFCAFLYVFCALNGLKKIFKDNYYLAFLVFLISPYFFGNGISGIRSGVAASLFLMGVGVYYDKGNVWKAFCWFLLGVLFHLSMIVPLFFFFISRYITNTKIIFLGWLTSIGLSLLNINIIIGIVEQIRIFEERVGDYAINEGERDFWTNFIIFGFFPVVFAVYNVVVLNYKEGFYKRLINAYMLIHIPYIILLDSEYGLRIGYLSEFMLPIILLYPLLVNPVLKVEYVRLKLSVLLFVVFLIKAYKVLIV